MKTAIAFAAALGAAAPVAASTYEPMSMTVEYGDLNLTSEHGQERLSRRIDSAARKVCGFRSRANTSIVENGHAVACYRQARAQALVQFAAVVEQSAKGG